MKRPRERCENEENEETKRERQDQNVSETEDRLSDLPDSILLHILSFLTAKEAIQTCILSTRWKHLWKHLSTVKLSSNEFKTLKCFTKFVTKILSLRDSSSALSALTFQRRGTVQPNLLKRMVRYALSHNVHRIGLYCHIKDIQPSLFSSHTLKNLSLDGYRKNLSSPAVFPNNLNLPALTTLNLCHLAFRAEENGCADPFYGFTRLNSLVIDFCMVPDEKTLCISNTTLIDLFLNPVRRSNGDYPNPKFDLYAPKLCTFCFHGAPFQNLCGSNLSSLKHLNIDSYWNYGYHLILLNWLIELAHIKSLTMSVRTLEVLFPDPHKLKVKLPSLCNLKILKVEIKPGCHSHVPDEIVDLLLQNAPLAKICIQKAS